MKPLRTLSAAAALAVLGAAIVAVPASAHTPDVTADCSSVSVALVSYTTNDDPNPNVVTVTIDGAQVAQQPFGDAFTQNYPFSDTTIGHEWSVHVDSIDDAYDRDFGGTTEPCTAPPAIQDATAELSVTDPTCTSGATLVLGEVSNATWGEPTSTTGPADYAVTATALENHAFDGDLETLEFTGTLAGPVTGSTCDTEPTPPVEPPVTPPTQPQPTVAVAFDEAADCGTDVVTRTTTKTTTDTVLNEEGTEWVPAEPVVVTTVTTRPTDAIDCPTTVAQGPPPGGDTLAVTGADPAPFLWAAGILAAIGAALLVRPRRGSKTLV
jgi:hypothetical protein